MKELELELEMDKKTSKKIKEMLKEIHRELVHTSLTIAKKRKGEKATVNDFMLELNSFVLDIIAGFIDYHVSFGKWLEKQLEKKKNEDDATKYIL